MQCGNDANSEIIEELLREPSTNVKVLKIAMVKYDNCMKKCASVGKRYEDCDKDECGNF
jgi:hypothetical protein